MNSKPTTKGYLTWYQYILAIIEFHGEVGTGAIYKFIVVNCGCIPLHRHHLSLRLSEMRVLGLVVCTKEVPRAGQPEKFWKVNNWNELNEIVK